MFRSAAEEYYDEAVLRNNILMLRRIRKQLESAGYRMMMMMSTLQCHLHGWVARPYSVRSEDTPEGISPVGETDRVK